MSSDFLDIERLYYKKIKVGKAFSRLLINILKPNYI